MTKGERVDDMKCAMCGLSLNGENIEDHIRLFHTPTNMEAAWRAHTESYWREKVAGEIEKERQKLINFNHTYDSEVGIAINELAKVAAIARGNK